MVFLQIMTGSFRLVILGTLHIGTLIMLKLICPVWNFTTMRHKNITTTKPSSNSWPTKWSILSYYCKLLNLWVVSYIACSLSLICVCACAHICIHTCMYIPIWIYTYMHDTCVHYTWCMYACMHMHIYAWCVCVYTYINENNLLPGSVFI